MVRNLAALLCCLAFLFSADARAQAILTNEKGEHGKQVLSLPYAFYNEHFGLAAGWVHGTTGALQPQSSLIVTGMAGTQGSAMAALIGRDIRLPWSRRLFVDPVIPAVTRPSFDPSQ